MGRHRTSHPHRRGESLLTAWHMWGWGARGVRDDFMIWESGAVELLALEFQPPRTALCLRFWVGSSKVRLLGDCTRCRCLGRGP